MRTTFKDIVNAQKENLNVELIYLRNKHKGIDKDFIYFLKNQKQEAALRLINSAKNKQDIHRLFREHYKELETSYGCMFTCLLTGKIYDSYESIINLTKTHLAERFLEHDYSKSDVEEILRTYSTSIIEYINNHNALKHELLKKEAMHGTMVADYRKNISTEDYEQICSQLFKITADLDDFYRKKSMTEFVFKLLVVYPKDILLNDINFVKFELESGYFDQYFELLADKKEIPSLEERQKRFLNEKDITQEQRYRLSQIELLEQRVASLSSSTKDLILEKIKLIKQEPDIKKKATQIDSCFAYYESKYREEIVSSLYSPTSSREITDFRELDVAMIHVFIRNPNKILPDYERQVEKEIIESRGIKVTGTEELTEEEKAVFDAKIQYAIDILLNPVVTSESLNRESVYSDTTGLRWYISNTSDQISTSVISIDNLCNMGNCVGVGFDNQTISPENIIISSPFYQTTNMGVDNLEVEPEVRFRSFSAPLSELKKSKKTELVLYRKKGETKTEAAYVFAIINGYSKDQDRATIEAAQEYADKNNIKLIIFNNKKIRQSYEEYLASHLTEESQPEEVKKK